MKNEDEMLDDIIDKLGQLFDKNDASLIAAALTSLGFKIYKTVLSGSEYSKMQKHIVKRAQEIKPFTERKLH
jgi:hypothetical protein